MCLDSTFSELAVESVRVSVSRPVALVTSGVAIVVAGALTAVALGSTSSEPPANAPPPTFESGEEAIAFARNRAVSEFAASGDEAAEVRVSSVGTLASKFPDWFSELWGTLPQQRKVYVVYLHGSEGEFQPRGRPSSPAHPLPGDTLVVIVDSAGEFNAAIVTNDVTAAQPLDAIDPGP